MRRLVALPLVAASFALLAVPAHAARPAQPNPLPLCFYTQDFGRFCIPS